MDTELLDRFQEDRTSPIARDLKLNLKKFLSEGALEPVEAMLTLLATATSVGSEELAGFATGQLRELDLPADQIQEAAESAANHLRQSSHPSASARRVGSIPARSRASLYSGCTDKPDRSILRR